MTRGILPIFGPGSVRDPDSKIIQDGSALIERSRLDALGILLGNMYGLSVEQVEQLRRDTASKSKAKRASKTKSAPPPEGGNLTEMLESMIAARLAEKSEPVEPVDSLESLRRLLSSKR